jgi:hypothetical protein
MKGIAKPSLYFSAYPLKAIENSSSKQKTESPYLKAVLSAKPRASAHRARVFPMINPYKNPYEGTLRAVPMRINPANDVSAGIELTEKRWFHNYE